MTLTPPALSGATLTEANLAEAVAELLDRQRITETMLNFGRALDLHDWELYASTLHDPLEVDFFDLTGQAPAVTDPQSFARFAEAALGPLTLQHQYSNFSIQLDGDRASGIFYHVCRHRRPNRHGGDDYTQYGWYENSFVRTTEGWKISRLVHKFQWCDGNPTLIDSTTPEFIAAVGKVFGGGQ